MRNRGGNTTAGPYSYCSSFGFSNLKDKSWHFSNVEQRWGNVLTCDPDVEDNLESATYDDC